jgi:hypothetical protein
MGSSPNRHSGNGRAQFLAVSGQVNVPVTVGPVHPPHWSGPCPGTPARTRTLSKRPSKVQPAARARTSTGSSGAGRKSMGDRVGE